jgi:hypothetical protein
MTPASRPRAAQAAALLAIAAGGAFSYYQLGSRLFACGKDLAGAETRYWMALAAAQSLLFLFAGMSDRWRGVYRLVQYLTVPLVAVPLAQLAMAYPRIFVCLALLATAYWFAIRVRHSIGAGASHERTAIGPGAALAETAIFVLATLLVHSAIAFVVLHSPGVALDDRLFVAIAAVSALIAGWIVRRDAPTAPLSIAQLPPLGLLLVVLLRAKLPDGAYDSLFYKATLPVMIADWRTAITGAMDHTLLGTDFQEIINSQLRIADPSYPASLTTSLAFIALWLIVPSASRSLFPRQREPAHGLAANGLALLLVSLSEPLIAAGTAYQEPLMALLLAAALLPISAAWLFLGAAIAVKATAVFVVPLIVMAKCWPVPSWSLRELAVRLRSRPAVLAACLALAALTAGEQFYRNLAYTGRLTGVTETLSSVTDPEGRILARQESDPYASLVPQGFRERYVNTFVHVLTLDRWIQPGEFGFHIIPSSRLPAIAAVLCILLPLFPSFRRDRALMLALAAWAIGAFVMLRFVAQGRYLVPLSFGAALIVAYLAARVAPASDAYGRKAAVGFALAIGFVAIGDQLVGSFINNGWECRRSFRAPVVKNNYDAPETALERRLADIAAKYRAKSARRDVVPTILCENTVDRARYPGTHYLFAYVSFELNRRHLAARPDHEKLLPTSVLALCYTDPGFPEQLLPAGVRKDFSEVESVKTESGATVRIQVSRPLMAGARATSLYGRQMNPLGWWGQSAAPRDLMPLWGPERLTDTSPVDAPGGKGAFVTGSGTDKAGVLLSPFAVEFDNVDFATADRVVVELAMPYSNSDGMAVDFVFEGADGRRASVSIPVPAKPQAAPGPVWETKTIPVPSGIVGRGTLTVKAASPSGDTNADWIFFRQLKLTGDAR